MGAFVVLAAYGASQYAGMKSDGVTYGLLNLIGSFLLALTAIVPLNPGVLIVEGAWALLSLGVTLRALGRRRVASPAPISLDA
jgi:hypothetical protein